MPNEPMLPEDRPTPHEITTRALGELVKKWMQEQEERLNKRFDRVEALLVHIPQATETLREMAKEVIHVGAEQKAIARKQHKAAIKIESAAIRLGLNGEESNGEEP